LLAHSTIIVASDFYYVPSCKTKLWRLSPRLQRRYLQKAIHRDIGFLRAIDKIHTERSVEILERDVANLPPPIVDLHEDPISYSASRVLDIAIATFLHTGTA
jgi:hypothetical protein